MDILGNIIGRPVFSKLMRLLFPLAVVILIILSLPGLGLFIADVLGYGSAVNAWLESQFQVSHQLAISLPAAILLFLVPPLLILLYFLRLKRKPVAVSSTFLWQQSIEDLHVNRLMQWLRRNVLLLLQLLAVLMLIYGILGPRWHASHLSGRHYILMIDTSCSMSATDVPSYPTRLDWAKAQALREIDAATDGDSGMVIAFHETAEIRQSYTTNRAALRKAIEALTPSNRRTRIDEALSLAASLANPLRSTENEVAAPANPEPGKERTYVAVEGLQAELHLFSDGRFPPVPDFALANLNLIFHVPPVAAVNNRAITNLTAERDPTDPSRLIARAVVHNFSNHPYLARLGLERLDANGALLGRYEEDRLPGESDEEFARRQIIPANSVRPEITFTIPNVSETEPAILRLRLENAEDSLPQDDTAWITLGIVRRARVLIIGPSNEQLQNFIAAPAIQRIAEFSMLGPEVLSPDSKPESYRQPAQEGQYDLVIFDRCGPNHLEEMPAANTLFIGYPPPPFLPADRAKPSDPRAVTPVTGPLIRGWQSRHPVLQGLRALDTIAIADAFRLPELPPRTDRLIEGDRNHVLLAAIPRRAYTDLVLTFPLMTREGKWNTNWPLQITFPLFLRNVIVNFGNVRDAGAEESLHPGELKVIAARGATEARLQLPDGQMLKLERGSRPNFLIADTEQLGIYTLTWEEPRGSRRVPESRRFAVNLFDTSESDLTPAESITIGTTTVTADQPRKQPVDLWKIPITLGLIAVLLEWWIYNRRVSL